MSRKQFTIEQIIPKLREAEVSLLKEATMAVACRSLGVTEQTHYRWRKLYGGMRKDQAKRLKELEQENARLCKTLFDATLDKLILQRAHRGNS